MTTNARCWGMRVDHWETSNLLWSELEAGRLRQGWGYQADQDVRLLSKLRAEGKSLNDDQKSSWRGNRRLLATEDDAIQKGDLILVPHLPEYGVWSLVRVTGDYVFAVPDGATDFGHCLPVELISRRRPVQPNEPASSAPLRKAMKARQRLWNVDGFRTEVLALAEAVQRPGAAPSPVTAPLVEVLRAARTGAWEGLRKHFEGSSFEKPCVQLLEAIYRGEVEHTAGPSEQGADAICTYSDPLGIQQRVAVQIKMWEGEASWTRPLEQIRQAREAHELVTAGLVLSTATSVSPEFEGARRQLETELGIPVRVILRDELVELFLRHLPDLGASSVAD